MTDNRTTDRVDHSPRVRDAIDELMHKKDATDNRTTKLLRLLEERDEIFYNAGFDSGVKACLQIIDSYLDYPHSALENISKWVDEQWKECES